MADDPLKNEGQLRGEDFVDEIARRIQALTPEAMLDTGEEDAQAQPATQRLK